MIKPTTMIYSTPVSRVANKALKRGEQLGSETSYDTVIVVAGDSTNSVNSSTESVEVIQFEACLEVRLLTGLTH